MIAESAVFGRSLRKFVNNRVLQYGGAVEPIAGRKPAWQQPNGKYGGVGVYMNLLSQRGQHRDISHGKGGPSRTDQKEKLNTQKAHTPERNSAFVQKKFAYLKLLMKDPEVNTLPNIITMSRIIASPGLSLAIAYDMQVVALGGCIIFGFSDWLDGYIAKSYNQQSRLGAFLDPLADKILIGALSVGLASKGLLPIPLLLLWLGRDVALVAASFMKRAIDRPDGAHFFDTSSSATFEIKPSELSKINTGLQFLLLSVTLSHFAWGSPTLQYLEPLWWVTTVTTVSSGLMYLDGSGIAIIDRKGDGDKLK